MAKDAYYFSHDSNARHDQDIVKILAVYGWEGYGLFWAFIEIFREEANYKLPYTEGKTDKTLGFQMRTECERIATFVKDCVDADLFILDDGFLYSDSLLKRMALVDAKRAKASQSAKKRWNKTNGVNANALPTHSESNANGMQVKESKEKKKKEKKIKKPTPPPEEGKWLLSKKTTEIANKLGYSKEALADELEKIRNWAVNAGAKGKKLDWDRFLQNWLTNNQSQFAKPATFQKPTPVKRELPDANFTTDTDF